MNIHFGNERWNQAAALALRYDVFVSEQGISLKDEFDQLDTTDRNYYVAYEDDLVLGTIRYQKKNAYTLQPDRLCVKKEYRKKGIGEKLVLLLEDKGRQEHCTHSVLSAEVAVIPFYERLGYQVQSDCYLEDGILCVEMGKAL